MRAGAAVFLVLLAAYAATLGIASADGRRYAGDEPHHLLVAASLATDGDLDLRDQYATRAYAGWYDGVLAPRGVETNGRRHEPYGIGFALLLAPAYALGGPVAAELLCAALLALAFALAAALARRVVPDPWATGAALACGLSPPALAHATSVFPEAAAAAALAGAALLAVRARDAPTLPVAAASASLLAVLPWLGAKYTLAGAVIALALVRWLLVRGRRFQAFFAGEILLFSGILFVTVNEAFFGGPTPYSAQAPGDPPTGAVGMGEHLERAERLVALWVDRSAGALRWAPVIALAFWGLWQLYRSRRERVAVAVRDRMEVEVAALLCALACGAQVAVAAFLAPAITGPWFPGRHLVAALPLAVPLVAWGLRHAPRAGAALVALTAVTSVWLLVELRTGGGSWAPPASGAPLGPLEAALPDFSGPPTAGSVVALALAGAALGALAGREWHRRHAERRSL